MTKTVNYTAEQTAAVVASYTSGVTVEAIAKEVGKSVRSVVAKLVREGVYTSKAKERTGARMTKMEMLAKAEAAVGVAAGTFASFEKGTKAAIEALVAAVEFEFE